MLYMEYVDWKLFYQLEPWGCEVDDHRFWTLFTATAGSKEAKTPQHLFPRGPADVKHAQQDNSLVEAQLRFMFHQHNAVLAAKEGGQP